LQFRFGQRAGNWQFIHKERLPRNVESWLSQAV
jgi:hypothetical protein